MEALVSGMELGAVPDRAFWSGKRVLLTGHTGFKGGWLALWLEWLGAEVFAFALPPEPGPGIFRAARVSESCRASEFIDLRDAMAVKAAVTDWSPEIVLHLAAQPLVRRAIADPAYTFDVNVRGLVHLLEAMRQLSDLTVALVVTSDKVYLNNGSGRAFVETDALGGSEPYSASKASAEIVAAAYRITQFDGPMIATARAGNVLGGGDYATDRIGPDCVRAFASSQALRIRNPSATRPWQHVLDPVGGYLLYLEKLAAGACDRRALNFGPDNAETMTVAAVAERMMGDLGMGDAWVQADGKHPKEKQTLTLNAGLAAEAIGWRPALDMGKSVQWTADWHRAFDRDDDMRAFTLAQLEEYEGLL